MQRKRRRRTLPAASQSSWLVSTLLCFSALLWNDRTLSVEAFSSSATCLLSTNRHGVSCEATPQLDQLTVKELRERVKQVSTERGTLSRLKRKQDLVEFLQSHSSLQKTSKRPSPTQMPPLTQEGRIFSTREHGEHELPKKNIFERVYQRYPSLRHANSMSPTTHGNSNDSSNNINNNDDEQQEEKDRHDGQDPRQWQHPIFSGHHNITSDMDIIFVGTASCTPGVTRGVSCTALRLNWRRRTDQFNPQTGRMEPFGDAFLGGTWLFDVGECTQLQIQRTTNIRPGKITKIFLTHAHGDHTFGLPGLLCLMGEAYNRDGTTPPVEIYGPEGLRMWLRVAIRYSVSRIVPPYRVHELMDLPMAPEWEFSTKSRRFFYRGRSQDQPKEWGSQGLAGQDPSSWISQANRMPLEASPLYGEIEGGRDIYPQYSHPLSNDGAPVYEVEDERDVKVYAAPMSHGIPCVGYVVHELPRPGRLRNELVDPIVQRNLEALRQAGYKIPLKAKAVIKNMPAGSSFTFPDGTVVTQEEAVEPERQGRRVVICGDTCDSRALLKLAQDADVVIHESTNAYLPGLESKDTDARSVTRDAILHGHSTPAIAARFAKAVQAKRLVLNHFSSRYMGDTSVESLSIMQRIEEQAVRQVPGWNETHVAAAWDFMVLPVPPK